MALVFVLFIDWYFNITKIQYFESSYEQTNINKII